ncbi:hypothetical protein PAPHI01_2149 [Pancytospora philotis]|nr:hypothetical protein PAPHI01_2149 [Pancytospora philotis]
MSRKPAKQTREENSESSSASSSAGESGSAGDSSSSFDYQIVKKKLTHDDAPMLLNQDTYIDYMSRFLEHLPEVDAITSGDLVLGYCVLANYDEIGGCFERRIIDTVSGLLDNIHLTAVDKDVEDLKAERRKMEHKVYDTYDYANRKLFYCARYANVPIDIVYELYEKAQLTAKLEDEFVVVISPVAPLEKDALDAACAEFPEFSRYNLRSWPRRSEEVFLLAHKTMKYVEVHGVKYRIFLLLTEHFRQFIKDFGAEVRASKE